MKILRTFRSSCSASRHHKWQQQSCDAMQWKRSPGLRSAAMASTALPQRGPCEVAAAAASGGQAVGPLCPGWRKPWLLGPLPAGWRSPSLRTWLQQGAVGTGQPATEWCEHPNKLLLKQTFHIWVSSRTLSSEAWQAIEIDWWCFCSLTKTFFGWKNLTCSRGNSICAGLLAGHKCKTLRTCAGVT